MSVSPPPNPERKARKRGVFRREHFGLLALFCFVSLALHLGAGYTSRSFNFNLPKVLPTPAPAEVEIALAPAEAPAKPAAPLPQIFTPALKAPPAPKPAPRTVSPPRTVQKQTPQIAKTVPREFVPIVPKTIPVPVARKAEIKPELKPVPPRLGLQNGQRDLPDITATPRPQPLPSVAIAPRLQPTPNPVSTPLPLATPPPAESTPAPKPVQANNAGANSGGGAGTPAEVPSVNNPEADPKPALGAFAPNTPLTGGKNGGSGGGTGGGVGKGTNAGNSPGAGPYGITRGVPFGDRLGVPKGDPNGGGGGYKHPFRLTLQPENTDGTPPVHIVYVIDTSGSMEEGGKIKRAREALQKALSELRTDDTFNIVPFSDRARTIFPKMSKVNNTTISTANTNIDFLEPSGETDLSDAIDLALNQTEVSHIFVLSDGEPTRGIIDYPLLLAHVRERNPRNVHIITLALGLGEKFPGIALLRALADQNDGKFDYVNLKGR